MTNLSPLRTLTPAPRLLDAQPKFKAVSLEGGPIIKTVSRRNTGLETKKPYQWGPLGGYY